MRRPALALAAWLTGCAVLLTGCGDAARSQDTASSSSSPSAAPTASMSAEASPARCAQAPPSGPVDQSLQDFAFDNGSATVSLQSPGRGSDCYSFPRWGNADPAVPIDSLLFLFKGPASDGVTIDMLVGDLTTRTTLNARVAVAIDGTTYRADNCTMKLTALSSAGVAGEFSCPTATEVFGNPFAPLDDPEPEPSTSTPLPTAVVSGWFTVAP